MGDKVIRRVTKNGKYGIGILIPKYWVKDKKLDLKLGDFVSIEYTAHNQTIKIKKASQ